MRKLLLSLATAVLLITTKAVAPAEESLICKTDEEIVQNYKEEIIKDKIQDKLKANNSNKKLKFINKLLNENEQLFNDSSMTRIYNISERHNIEPEWVILTMFKESRINTKAVNPFSNATGVLQWTPRTARYLGTSTSEIKEMSFYQQLKYVDKYIKMVNKSHLINSYEDFYLAVFYPKALGKDLNYVIAGKNSLVSKQNKVISRNGVITVKDFKTYANKI